jgi:transcriptional/translational regulatory protein YebC/TACO1
VQSDEEGHTIFTAFESQAEVLDALTAKLGDPKSTAIIWRAQSETPVEGEGVHAVLKLIDALDDDDDVQNVWTNAGISDADMEKFGG